MNLKVRHFETLVNKLGLRTRNTGDRHAFFEHEGRLIAKTKRSFGRGDVPADLIRQQLKLNEEQLRGVVDCSLTRDDYIGILRGKGLL